MLEFSLIVLLEFLLVVSLAFLLPALLKPLPIPPLVAGGPTCFRWGQAPPPAPAAGWEVGAIDQRRL